MVGGLAGVILSACPGNALAADTLLSTVDLRLQDEVVQAELWGDCLNNGYASDLLVLLKRDKKVLAAYNPTISGGYNCLLSTVQIKPVKENSQRDKKTLPQQLLISAAQGDWSVGTEYRILDFANIEKVTELFSGVDSMGIISKAELAGNNLILDFADGQKNEAVLPSGLVDTGAVYYGGLHSLTAYDLDDDGQDELLTTQQIKQEDTLLADVGSIWRLTKSTDEQNRKDKNLKHWQWDKGSITVMTAVPVPKDNVINDGQNNKQGSVLVRKIVIPGGEATYPMFASSDIKLTNKVNKLLHKECAKTFPDFYNGTADMAFKVVRNDDLLLTVQLIHGKSRFIHHNVNIDPKTGKQLYLKNILDVKNKELPALLKVLCTNNKMDFSQGIPDEWYIEGNNLFLVQNIDDKEEVAGFALGNLHKYILDNKWLKKNTD
jgi:hypothetical protein